MQTSNINDNTCPAFFLAATIDSAGNYSPCTALGGGAFKFGQQPLKTIWLNNELETVRKQSASGEKLPMCKRCWSEEAIGMVSERIQLKTNLSSQNDYTETDYYQRGPKYLNIKVSNICNLRCRTCQSLDSYLYHIEGEYYEKKNNLKNTHYTSAKFKKHFSDQQLDELYELSSNLDRIELYGGEPFLDDQVPKFLLKLVDTGLAKNIDLRVSTNATYELTPQWKEILTGFRESVINVSIDGIGPKFTYMRHPGKWETAEKNIKEFLNLEYTNTTITIVPVVTVSALNVWNISDVFDYFANYNIEPFIILVQWPSYYCVNVLPEKIKPLVEQKLNSYGNPKFNVIVNLMNTLPKSSNPTEVLTLWQQFKFWTKEKDAYRKENFINTFPEIGRLLINHNEWE